jgi:hypothetical protein
MTARQATAREVAAQACRVPKHATEDDVLHGIILHTEHNAHVCVRGDEIATLTERDLNWLEGISREELQRCFEQGQKLKERNPGEPCVPIASSSNDITWEVKPWEVYWPRDKEE